METDIDLASEIGEQKLELWQQKGQKTKVQIVGMDGKTASGEVFIQRLNKDARIRRALKTGAIFWGIALFCVLIPVLHFFLVPLFFLLGPLAAYLVYRTQGMILGGVGLCPRCNEKLPIEKSDESWPLKDLCTGCHCSVKISLLEENV